MLGVLVSAGAAIGLATSRCPQEWNVAQAIDAVTGTRLWLLSFIFLERFCFGFCFFLLGGCCNRYSAAVVQWLVHFSTHPQVMQQHRQLSGRGHDRPLLAVSPTALRQFQSPAPEIAVHAEWSQNVLRSLHQQRPQIGIALFADVQLRLALSRVPASRLLRKRCGSSRVSM